MGAWVTGSSMGDWITLMVFGVVGWVMKQSGWARPPLVPQRTMVLEGIRGIVRGAHGPHIELLQEPIRAKRFVLQPFVAALVDPPGRGFVESPIAVAHSPSGAGSVSASGPGASARTAAASGRAADPRKHSRR